MKDKFRAFFSNVRKNKDRRIGFILTIVALVEILALLVVSTSAWVESISSIKIYTTYDASSAPSGTKGTVESMKMQQASLATGNNGDIDLRNYFRQSGDYHLCGASSIDGNTMYFPEIKGGNTSNYRIGNVNDKGVNYISFTIKTTTAVPLAFDAVPTFKFGGTALSGNNQKLVRFSIGDNAGNYRVYSMYPSKFTEDVPAADDGTTQSVTVYPFADYVKGVNKAVDTTANGYLSFNLWIQDPTGASSSVYHNKAFTVSNLKLVTVIPVTLKSTYIDDNGKYQEGTASLYGGTVAISSTSAAGSEIYAYQTTFYAAPSQKIYMKAKASETNGYSFLGFYTGLSSNIINKTSVTATSTDNPYEYTVPSGVNSATAYAMFSDTHNIYMKPEYQHGSTVRYAAYVFGVDSSTGQTTSKWYNMSSATFDGDTGYFKCTYRGSANTIIFCYMNGGNTTNSWANCWLQTYDLVVPSRPGEYAYNVTCRQVVNGKYVVIDGVNTYVSNPRNQNISQYGTNRLLGFWRHNHVKVNVAYTNTSASGANDAIYASLTDTSVEHNKAIWYDDKNKNNKFLFLDGKEYQNIDSSGNIIPQYHYNKEVTLTAEVAASSNYKFDGWYSTASGTGTTNRLTTSLTYSPSNIPDNGTYTGTNIEQQITYYAKYSLKPKKTFNIYVAPRENWSQYYVVLRDNYGQINNIEATYDGNTGYYKASFTNYYKANTKIEYSLNGGTNWVTLIDNIGAPTSDTTWNKKISTSDGVADMSNYRCIWFIITEDWLKNNLKNDGDYMQIWDGSSNSNMRRINDGAYVCEYSSSPGSIWIKQMKSDNNKRNEWSTTVPSGKSQYKETSYNSGSWQ